MSNAVTLFGGGATTLPAHIAARELNANTLALAGNAPQGKRISIEGGVFRLIAGGKEIAKNKDRDMNVVIVRTAPTTSRTYYDPSVPYVRGQATAPTCSSTDGVRPDKQVRNPQASACDKCPQNVAGSGNGDSRACRYNRRLAVVLEGDMDGDVYQLNLAATSLFGKGNGTQNLPLEAYARMLASNRVNVDSVVTKVEFDTDASTPKLTFSPVRFLDPKELAIVEAQGNTPEAEQAIGLTPYQMDSGNAQIAAPATPVEAPAPTKRGFVTADEDEDGEDETPAPTPVKKTRAKAAPAPVTADDADDNIPEPVKAAAPEQPRASAISNVLAAWGDD